MRPWNKRLRRHVWRRVCMPRLRLQRLLPGLRDSRHVLGVGRMVLHVHGCLGRPLLLLCPSVQLWRLAVPCRWMMVRICMLEGRRHRTSTCMMVLQWCALARGGRGSGVRVGASGKGTRAGGPVDGLRHDSPIFSLCKVY